MDPFDTDRPTLDRASLDRIEALRAQPPKAPPPSRSVAPWVLTAMLLAFALGLIANPWFERRVRSNLPGFAATTLPTVAELDAARDEVRALKTRVAALEARPAGAGAGTPIAGERLMRAETRIDGLETTAGDTAKRVDALTATSAGLAAKIDTTASATQATLATAARGAEAAQAVLLLTTTRRMLENGEKLGPVEPVLQRAFGGGYPQPVAAVVALGAAPVTPRSLRVDLLRLRPALTGTAAPGASGPASWWDSLTDGLSNMIRVRENGATAAAPADPAMRVDTALAALAAGNVGTAAAQISALPPPRRAAAAGWLASAARWQAGMRGLATIEQAALAPPPLVPPPLVPPSLVPVVVAPTR